jgi:nucleotide-binding universal stress UspA family protein
LGLGPDAPMSRRRDAGAVPSIPHVELARERAETVAGEAARQARESALEVETFVRCGAAVDEICGIAQRRQAQLIVIGSHGWRRLRGALLGSVSAGVLHHAPCPVMVVPARSRRKANTTATFERVATEV